MLTCPSCGQENGDGARFCNACAAELSAAAAREVRKTVTVLFAEGTSPPQRRSRPPRQSAQLQ